MRRLAIDMSTHVGSVELANPVMTASGTSGYGAELAPYVDLSALGAVVTKSLAPFAWPGNPAPRVVSGPASMLNSVGLQGPGLGPWLDKELPELLRRGVRVVASIWGRNVAEFGEAAGILNGVEGIVAIEVNMSCPNVEDRSRIFAHSPAAVADVVWASLAAGMPVWAKLSPNTPDIVAVAGAALGAGAEGVVLVNTLLGMAVDVKTQTYALGSGSAGGGVSGPALRPVAVRAVHDCRAAFPRAGIVGVGGVSKGRHAVELMMAGADAVEVGTATLLDPSAVARVRKELRRWCAWNGVGRVRDLVSAVHRGGPDGGPGDSLGTDEALGADGPPGRWRGVDGD